MTHEFKSKLEDFRKELNVAGLNELWDSQSATASEETKQLFVEAYQYIYEMLSYDLACMRFEDELGVLEDLLDILRTIEKIDPKSELLSFLGFTYSQLADRTEDENEKLHFLDQAIFEHTKYQQISGHTTERNVAEVLFEQMNIRQQYEANKIAAILQLLNLAFAKYSNEALWSFSRVCFGLLELPEKIAKPSFNQFFDAIKSTLAKHAANNVLVYYEWEKILENYQSKPFVEKAEAAKIINEKLFALEQLKNYKTTDHDVLNNLGSTFARSARFHTGAQQIEYYEIAVDYFLQAKKIQYLAWTYPVYATNALKEMAHLYFDQGDQRKALECFQRAEQIFEESNLPDFTFNSYWAEFLLDFCKTIYNFNNEPLLNKAKEKFLVTKGLGQNSYSSPFVGIAKILLKQGHKEECLQELQDCDQAFKPLGTQLGPLLEDEDFESIWPEIENLMQKK